MVEALQFIPTGSASVAGLLDTEISNRAWAFPVTQMLEMLILFHACFVIQLLAPQQLSKV